MSLQYAISFDLLQNIQLWRNKLLFGISCIPILLSAELRTVLLPLVYFQSPTFSNSCMYRQIRLMVLHYRSPEVLCAILRISRLARQTQLFPVVHSHVRNVIQSTSSPWNCAGYRVSSSDS